MSTDDGLRGMFRSGDDAEVLRAASAEIERAQQSGDLSGEVEGLYAMARVALRADDLAAAEDLARRALAVAQRSGERRLEERPRHVLAAVARMSGDFALARDQYLASIELNEALGQSEFVHSERHNLAFTELHLGHLDRARELFADSRDRTFRSGYRDFLPYLGVAAVALAAADGDAVRVAQMLGFTERAFASIGQVPDPDDDRELLTAHDDAVAALGSRRFGDARAVGAEWTPLEAFGRTWDQPVAAPGVGSVNTV